MKLGNKEIIQECVKLIIHLLTVSKSSKQGSSVPLACQKSHSVEAAGHRLLKYSSLVQKKIPYNTYLFVPWKKIQHQQKS